MAIILKKNSFQFDLTKNSGFVLIIAVVGTLGIVALSIAYYFTHLNLLHIAIAIVGCLLISMVKNNTFLYIIIFIH